MGKFQDLTGIRYGKLTVIKRADFNNQRNQVMWVCQCDCGNQTTTTGNNLKNGHTKSCGCAVRDYHNRRHNSGAKSHGLYRLYSAIKSRCYNKNDIHYADYGGRGIKMANEWLQDYWLFAETLETLPHYGEDGYSIDRIDVNGDYSPGNVRWATAAQQANNRRKNNRVYGYGEEKTISEWANQFGINYYTLWSRVNEQGLSLEQAIEKPIKGHNEQGDP